MSLLLTQKYKKKIIYFLSSYIVATTVITLIACSSYDVKNTPKLKQEPAPVDIPKQNEFKFLEKGASVYSKKTPVGNKSYIQINLYGYNDFTFSNWYPTFANTNSLKDKELIIRNSSENKTKEDPEFSTMSYRLIILGKTTYEQELIRKKWGLFARKYKWIYNNSPIYNSLSEKQKENYYLVDAFEQNQEPDFQKFISLIKNDNDLKLTLRLDQNSRKVYHDYLKSIASKSGLENAEDKDIYLEKKYLPWSKTFNYETIKSRLDFEKYDYLFIKDMSNFFVNKGRGNELFLEGGLEINDYEINQNNKTIHIEWSHKSTVPADDERWLIVPGIVSTDIPKRFHSFFIPVAKGKISDFKVNDWSMISQSNK
ncbi:hypothetical protein ACA758_03435 [Mycoplasmopsis agassizii]|uniref:hypothetical protein n=1 Tax=Mycoplasmopsis agassizii TaxID=33922 RepID=UPI0035270D39